MLKKLLISAFNKAGYDLKRKSSSVNTNRAEGFPMRLQEAKELGIDVNDHINNRLSDPRKVLEKIVFPYFKDLKDPVTVCEIGVGTGRWSRVIADELRNKDNWTLYLIDHSPWIINFLKEYFASIPSVKPILNDGRTLPFHQNDFIDLVFSDGTFIELSLVKIYSYCKEFRRVLKPGGFLIFNYNDVDSIEGYEHLKQKYNKPNNTFTYHSRDTIHKIFEENGFEAIDSIVLGSSTYLILCKS